MLVGSLKGEEEFSYRKQDGMYKVLYIKKNKTMTKNVANLHLLLIKFFSINSNYIKKFLCCLENMKL